MTLCLAQSIVEQKGKFDLRDQIRKYCRWHERGHLSSTGTCFDIGNATREALGIWGDTFGRGRGLEEGRAIVAERLNRQQCCGNGSLMRCVPVPLVYHRDPGEVQRNAGLASTPTHPHQTCVEACQVYSFAVGEILRNGGLGTVKEDLFGEVRRRGIETTGLKSVFEGYGTLEEFRGVEEGAISSSGYVVHTLEAALWAFFTTETFREGALRVVNLGDDADTVGAVYGGLAGAFYGIEGVPGEWVEGLYARGVVDEVVEGVVRLVGEREAKFLGKGIGEQEAAAYG